MKGNGMGTKNAAATEPWETHNDELDETELFMRSSPYRVELDVADPLRLGICPRSTPCSNHYRTRAWNLPVPTPSDIM